MGGSQWRWDVAVTGGAGASGQRLIYFTWKKEMFAVAPLREEGKLWTSVTECQNSTPKSLVSFNSSLEGL